MICYFDNAASTKPYDEVVSFYALQASRNYANPSALHSFGSEAARAVEYAKGEVLKLYKFENHEVIFTSGATESANLAIKGTMEKYSDISNSQMIITDIEHPCVSETADYIEKLGAKVIRLSGDEKGKIDPEMLKSLVNRQTKLVSIIWVNNETGIIQDIEGIISAVKSANPSALVHIDATQGFGKIEGNLAKADMVSISAHKFHGLKGIGALIYKKNLTFSPQILGGGQQNNLRSGTVNSPLIASLGKTCELTDIRAVYSKLTDLKAYLTEKLTLLFSADCINSGAEGYSPHIVSLSFPGLKGEVLVHMLEEKEIYVSTSSACSAHKKTKTVLSALGFDKARIEGTLRISLSDFNTFEQIDILADALEKSVNTLTSLKKGKA
ncbi:MAG: cysteine desulfurase [Eubacteriaceae bacterium]|nr:cysteine desulfurase [Eubacteriaceae bacterium]